MRVERNLSVGLLRNIARDALARRQFDAPRLLQPQQQVARRKLLVAPVGLAPIPQLTQASRDNAAASRIMRGNRRLHLRDVLLPQIRAR